MTNCTTRPDSTFWLLPVVLVATALVSLAGPSPAAAQQTEELRRRAEQLLGQPISDEEILQRLQQSGLSPQDLRNRLSAQGYDPRLADPWVQALGSGTGEVPGGVSRTPIMSVLGSAEVGLEAREERLGQVPARLDTTESDIPYEVTEDTLPPVFGRKLFQRATSQFEPSLTGPVPDDYQLAPGDRLQLVLTGAVENGYLLEVTRDGWVVVPEVGRVPVAGKTLSELRETLLNRLSQVYSGITREPGGATQFEISVAQLRTNQVYVVGEVERPAAYRVSGMATALTALYRAAGPTRNGSFREIVVNRGGEKVAEIDLYEYLLRGRAGDDVRLRSGDIVFVPVAEEQVRVEGPVTRPGIYEPTDGEGLRDVLRFAGGVEPTAELKRVQIERILPADQRAPGQDRAILDVPVTDVRAPADSTELIPVRDGDHVSLFAVLEEPRNRVRVSGGVWRPGTYGVSDSTRLWDVIEKAGGLLPDVYEGRAQIQRLQDDWTRRMMPVSLARTEQGEPAENPRIEGMDQLYIYAQRNLREDRQVSIGGWVQEPGVYPYAEGMTVKDLILRAGGLRTGARLEAAEVSRVVISQERTDTLSRSFRVPLESDYVVAGDTVSAGHEGYQDVGADGDGSDGESAQAAAREFELRNLDAVFVRRSPGYEPQKTVQVTGEVLYPGPYSIQTRGERLTGLIRRAGGLTDEAYRQGLQLWRRSGRPEEADTDTAAAAERLRTAAGLEGAMGAADTAGGGRSGTSDTAAFTPTGQLQRDTAGVSARTRVGLDFVRAMQEPSSPANVQLQPGDSIHVPQLDPTVTVRGAVGVATKVLHRDGAGLGYYIEQAGGYRENAAEGRTRVRYANGEIRTKGGGFLFFGGGVPDPDPGSTVFVPQKPPRERGMSLQAIVGLMSTAASAVATVIIATQ